MFHKFEMDKRGVLGLDTVRDVMLIFLVISIIAVAIILTMFSLRGQDATVQSFSLHAANETIPIINSSSIFILAGDALGDECSATVDALQIYNNTAGPTHVVINENNFTIANCGIILKKESTVSTVTWNNTKINISYGFTYKTNTTNDLGLNLSSSVSGFFENTGTIFAILIVVVIILAIAIIIAVVSRFTGGRASGTIGGGGGERGAGAGTVMGV